MESFLTFDARVIRERVPMKKAIDLMRSAFIQLSEGKVVVPVRSALPSLDEKGIALFMPSYSPSWQLFGLKMVSVFPENKDIPAVQGKMLVMDSTNGRPLAMFEASALTSLRTGAASGLATELLSAPSSSTLAVFGTGAQAATQVEGVLAVRQIRKVLVKGTSREKELSFCRQLMSSYAINCAPLEYPEEIREADIICTATTSTQPVVSLSVIRPGAHVNGVGSFKPIMREIDTDAVKASLLIVDHRKSALEEAGDIVIPLTAGDINVSHIHAELGEVLSGKKVGRSSPSQITLFKSVGNAVQDLAIAKYLIS